MFFEHWQLSNWTESTLNWLELSNDTIVFIEMLCSNILFCLIFDEVCIFNSVTLLFITMKLLSNNMYCMKYLIWIMLHLQINSQKCKSSKKRQMDINCGISPSFFHFLHYSSYIYKYATLNIQWGKKVFSQPPIVQVLPLKKMREACNFHHRYTSTMRDKIRGKNP